MITLRVPRILSVFVSVVATAHVIMWSGYASAGVLAINFPGDLADPGFEVKHNSTAKGFRISPGCHYDSSVLTVNSTPAPGIGWDRGGCPPFNSESLGGQLYVDDNGLLFGLLSLESIGQSFVAQSSKGGMVTIPNNLNPAAALHFDFIGPQWLDIQWVTFFYGDPGAPVAGFSQLVVLVPAPSTLGMLGLGVSIFSWLPRSLRRRVAGQSSVTRALE